MKSWIRRAGIDIGIVALVLCIWVIGHHLWIDHQNLHELVRIEVAKRASAAGAK